MPNRAALARHAAERFVASARAAIAARGRFAVALAGGATPRETYALLATPEFAAQVEWARVHVFFGDERAVPPEHPDSNFRMARDALLARVPLPPQNVQRIRAELGPADAARAYEETLREFFREHIHPHRAPKHRNARGKHSAGSLPVAGEPPVLQSPSFWVADAPIPSFDLILLGLGADGHTASLLPRTPVLRETTRWVAPVYARRAKMWRVTLTLPVINAAANILFLVAGADKAEAVRAVLRGARRPNDLPAQAVRPRAGQVVWLLDEAAGQKIERTKGDL